MENKVTCLLCGNKFSRITNTHLKERHKITIEKYKKQFPEALIDVAGLADRRVRHLKGKKYEGIYGNEKAEKLKSNQSMKTKKAWRVNPLKVEIRRLAKERREMLDLERKINPPLIGRKRDPQNHGVVICENCGQEFDYRKSDSGGFFCTHDCWIEYSRRNSSDYRKKALFHYGYVCDICGKKELLLVHHKDGERLNNDLDNLQILCAVCHKKQHILASSYRGVFSEAAIERGVREILAGLRVDIRDANFFDTPKRVSKMFGEILEGLLPESKIEIKEMLTKTFPCDNEDMVIVKNICCWSLCPHHLLPVKYIIHMAYIPNQKVLGLSKLPRLVVLLAKQPILQEQLGHIITTSLEENTQAKGVIVNITGEHLCMQMRGVKALGSLAETTSVRGYFAENHGGCKDEFLARISSRM